MPSCLCGFTVKTSAHLENHLNFYVAALKTAERLGNPIRLRHGVA